VVPGLIIERGDMTNREIIEHTCRQVVLSLQQAGGYSVFAYSLLFDRPGERPRAENAEARSDRAERRRVLLPFLRAQAANHRGG
jgi:hypothetical protein